VRGYEAKALLTKTVQTSQSQNFVLQMYNFCRQNEVFGGVCALHVLQCTLLEATEKVEIYKSFSMPQSRDALFV